MKQQALFSLKDIRKKLKCRLLQFLFGALRVWYRGIQLFLPFRTKLVLQKWDLLFKTTPAANSFDKQVSLLIRRREN